MRGFFKISLILFLFTVTIKFSLCLKHFKPYKLSSNICFTPLKASPHSLSVNSFLKPRISLDVGPKIIGVAYSNSLNQIKGLQNIESEGNFDSVADQVLVYGLNLLNYNTPYKTSETIDPQSIKDKIQKYLSEIKGTPAPASSSSASSSASSSTPMQSLSNSDKSMEIVLSSPFNINGEFDLNIPNARLSFNLALILYNKIVDRNLYKNIKIKLFDERFTTMEARILKKKENQCKFSTFHLCLALF